MTPLTRANSFWKSFEPLRQSEPTVTLAGRDRKDLRDRVSSWRNAFDHAAWCECALFNLLIIPNLMIWCSAHHFGQNFMYWDRIHVWRWSLLSEIYFSEVQLVMAWIWGLTFTSHSCKLQQLSYHLSSFLPASHSLNFFCDVGFDLATRTQGKTNCILRSAVHLCGEREVHRSLWPWHWCDVVWLGRLFIWASWWNLRSLPNMFRVWIWLATWPF